MERAAEGDDAEMMEGGRQLGSEGPDKKRSEEGERKATKLIAYLCNLVVERGISRGEMEGNGTPSSQGQLTPLGSLSRLASASLSKMVSFMSTSSRVLPRLSLSWQ